ncbi:hypothetical protein ARMGADRAFT_1019403 [Armillaria gallica]|uniref:Uncharacterized protein n=1 Tax=Armillaria gallica TaxID=47427 RepID=A0A2H3CI87_ARMGA|nr:hypothetical protein ARMGADRAFT_1019403 [Armillaria gallica]
MVRSGKWVQISFLNRPSFRPERLFACASRRCIWPLTNDIALLTWWLWTRWFSSTITLAWRVLPFMVSEAHDLLLLLRCTLYETFTSASLASSQSDDVIFRLPPGT